MLNRVAGITLLGNGERVSGSKIVTGVVVNACEKSPARSAAVGSDPIMLLPLRLIVVPKLMVYWARGQFTIFGNVQRPADVRIQVVVGRVRLLRGLSVERIRRRIKRRVAHRNRHRTLHRRCGAPPVADAGELSIEGTASGAPGLSASICVLSQSAAAAACASKATATAATTSAEAAATTTAGTRARPETSTWSTAAAAIGRRARANAESSVDRAGAEAAQSQAVIRQTRAHSRRQAGAHLQTLCRRNSATRSAGPAWAPRTAAAAHGALPSRFVIARLFQTAADASVDQQRFVGIAAQVGVLYRRLLRLRVGLLPLRSGPYRGTLKSRLRLTRNTASRTLPTALSAAALASRESCRLHADHPDLDCRARRVLRGRHRGQRAVELPPPRLPAATAAPPRSESLGMFNTQSRLRSPSLTVTWPLAVVNSNMLTSICHTPGVSSSV